MANDSVPLSSIPVYLRNASPVPADKRTPWYMNTAPTYAGIFLWFAFYEGLGSTLQTGSLLSVLIGVVLAGAVCHLMFYYVPGMLGMKTGLPLYIVGTSTFGTKGGYFIPGFFMGLLQIGWYSVAIFYLTQLVLHGFDQPAITPYGPMDGPWEKGLAPAFNSTFMILAIAFGYLFAFIGALGINYVAKMALIFPLVPIAMLLISAGEAVPHLGNFQATHKPLDDTWVSAASMMMIQLIVGFFGTAGAVGADFCSNNRNERDVKMAGLAGIWLAVLFAAGLGMLTVAGAHGLDPNMASWKYGDAVTALNTNTTTGQPNVLAKGMLLLFAVGSMASACFPPFIIGNSLSTMLGRPKARIPLTLGGATIGIIIALTGISSQLEAYFGLIGASFGPVIGAMIADYFLNGGQWAGPREGISVPGYGAWLIGFIVGISNNPMVTKMLGFELLPGWHPTGVYSLIVGFVVYILMARLMGLPARLEGVVRTESGKG